MISIAVSTRFVVCTDARLIADFAITRVRTVELLCMFPFGSKRIACRSATIHAALFILSNRSANKVEIKIKEIKIYNS